MNVSNPFREDGASKPIAKSLSVGMRGFDTIMQLKASEYKWLKEQGFDFAIRYLRNINSTEALDCIRSGLILLLVTYAKDYSGADAVQLANQVGYPLGCTIYFDLEGETSLPATIEKKIDDWSFQITHSKHEAGLYYGSGLVLTGAEIYKRPLITSYFESCSREIDRVGQVVDPNCGRSLIQLFPPNISLHGPDRIIVIDVDVAQQDYKGRLPKGMAL